MTANAEPWVEEMLAYWFGTLSYTQWFKQSDAVDAEIRRRFNDLYEALAAAPIVADDTALEPRSSLARIIALDQLPRNIHRGTPRAFSSDPKALALARLVVGRGLDQTMSREQRLFCYLPFEHSEDASDQATCVGLFEALGDPEWIRFAARHKEIIDRFGRFPHRNAVLGRTSTAEELAFLQEPNSAF